MLQLMTRGVGPDNEDTLDNDERRLLQKEQQRKEPRPRLKLKVPMKDANVTDSSKKEAKKTNSKEPTTIISNIQNSIPKEAAPAVSSTGHLKDGNCSHSNVGMAPSAMSKESALVIITGSSSKYKIRCIALLPIYSVR